MQCPRPAHVFSASRTHPRSSKIRSLKLQADVTMLRSLVKSRSLLWQLGCATRSPQASSAWLSTCDENECGRRMLERGASGTAASSSGRGPQYVYCGILRQPKFTAGMCSASRRPSPPSDNGTNENGNGDTQPGQGTKQDPTSSEDAEARINKPGEQRAPKGKGKAVGPDSSIVSGGKPSGEQEPEERVQRLQAAMRDGTLGFGFSAGGFVYPYHMGVLWELKRLGVLRGRVKMAGASAGALAIATYNSGLDVGPATEALVEFAKDCRSEGVMWRLGSLLKRFLERYLPDDVHERCSGNTFVAMTAVFPLWHPEVVSEFTSKADFIEALLASCHIPVYVNGTWFTRFRGRWFMDGAVLNLIPSPPTPNVIKVCCFPVNELLAKVPQKVQHSTKRIEHLLDVAISPDAFEPWPYNYRTMAKWALQPAPDEDLHMMVERGRRDAATWARRMQLVEDELGASEKESAKAVPWLGAP